MNKSRLIILALIIGHSAPLLADQPLSAIDWLSNSVTKPMVRQNIPPADFSQSDISNNASVEDVSVTTLGGPTPDAVGLLPTSITGLPRDLWGATPSDELARIIHSLPAENLPATQELLKMILLAELDAPANADGSGVLFLARIDKLLDMGTLDQAHALLQRAGPNSPRLFRRWFDVALLTGVEDAACETLSHNADIAPTFPTRIFCLARGGDWNAAVVTLETAKVLGRTTDEEDALLARFLDPTLFDNHPALPPPSHITPLVYRMLEAIGEPIPTSALPRAFSNADLRSDTGWKPRIQAAERLAQTGAIAENQLFGIYNERHPAASGGIWDRVDAVQAFDLAYRAKDPTAVAKTLPIVWQQIELARLEVPFATLYGAGLNRLPLQGKPAALAFRIGMLSPQYESIAAGYGPKTDADRFLVAIAQGDMEAVSAKKPTARAILAAFNSNQPPAQFKHMLENDRLGEAILLAIEQFNQGVGGDLADATKALILLRSIGFEDVARRASLQLMLLERRG